jgi:hypothetical protein
MGGKILGLTALLLIAGSSVAEGAFYSGSVLYQLTAPSGFTYSTTSGDPQTAAGGQVVGFGLAADVSQEAIVWTSDGTPVDLTTPGYISSHALGTDGAQQVGVGMLESSNTDALLWTGTGASAVDLTPNGFSTSIADGISGTQQVGSGVIGTGSNAQQHALLWTGSAETAVDLEPTSLTGFYGSVAYGIGGGQEVGEGELQIGSNYLSHALLWKGTAESAVDLDPSLAGFSTNNSFAYATNGSQQVGYYAYTSPELATSDHAMLWSDTAESAVDLNPTNLTGITDSEAFDIYGGEEVGVGGGSGTDNQLNAMLWFGTADSAVDLQALLPSSDDWTNSCAYTIDGSGNIYGIANGTVDGVAGTYAVEWSIPEPGSLSLLALVAPVLGARRRRTAL